MVSWGFALKKGATIYIWSMVWAIISIFAAIGALFLMSTEALVSLSATATAIGSLSFAAYERKDVGERLKKLGCIDSEGNP